MLVPGVGGPPTIPPSTKDAPAVVTTRPTSRAVLGETALASTNTPVNPAAATWSATASAACGGQTEKIRSLAAATAATVDTSVNALARAAGLPRRGLPPPRGRRDRGRRRASPIAAPISPGCSKPDAHAGGAYAPLPCWRCGREVVGGSRALAASRAAGRQPGRRRPAGRRPVRCRRRRARPRRSTGSRAVRRSSAPTVAVPVDYGDPAGPTLDLAVARVHARDSRAPHRVAGGQPRRSRRPRDPVRAGRWSTRCRGELRDRFDLVSFDPRGVGDSGAVKCGADIDPLFDQSFSPADAAERADSGRGVPHRRRRVRS